MKQTLYCHPERSAAKRSEVEGSKMKQYFVYLMASENSRSLYTGFTNNLERRVYEHKCGLITGFTKKYNCKKLVHYEVYEDPENAILREKEIKGWVRKRKNELIEKENPLWKDIDSSAQALQNDHSQVILKDLLDRRSLGEGGRPEGSGNRKTKMGSHPNPNRYTRQMALPEISAAAQAHLQTARIAVIGAGGLGAAALPYLAAAGIGHITIIDNDTVSVSNLHRQTIYTDAQEGQNKAELAAAYCRSLNPEIEIKCHPERLALKDLDSSAQALQNDNYDLLIDGSDNFETKTLLNQISIQTATPLLSASVNQWQGQIILLAGYAADKPCYHCLFPELPKEARNCNEAGILGTSAGLAGMYQAHMALCYLLGIENTEPGMLLTLDTKALRLQKLHLPKDPACAHCKDASQTWQPFYTAQDKTMTEMISMQDLASKDHIIVDVRTDAELAADPIPGALHMEVSTVPARYQELPRDTLLAFVCAGNVRSVKAVEYLQALGFDNVIVLDKFSL